MRQGLARAHLKKAERRYKRATGIPPTPTPFLLHSSTSSPLPSSKEFLLSSYVAREPLIRICLLSSNRVFPLDFLLISRSFFSKGGAVSIGPFRFGPRLPVIFLVTFPRWFMPSGYSLTRELARPCLVVSIRCKNEFVGDSSSIGDSGNSMDSCLLEVEIFWKVTFTQKLESFVKYFCNHWRSLHDLM